MYYYFFNYYYFGEYQLVCVGILPYQLQKNNFLNVTFRFRVIQLTKLPRIFVERSEELQVSCDPAYNPWAGKGRAHF